MTEKDVNLGWKCVQCKRMNKKLATYCQSCGNHWEQCAQTPNWRREVDDWERQPSPRRRSSSARKRTNPKGQGKHQSKNDAGGKRGHGTKGKDAKDALSPFAPATYLPSGSKPQYALPSAPLPWVVDGEGPSGSSNGNAGVAANPHSEVLLALKKMYPDPSQMPMELRTAMEKTEAQNSKQMTRDLHTATSQLGKAKRSLAEAKEARAGHRKAWFAYLAECATVWKEQQKNFVDHEQVLKAQEEKSRLEIIQITSQIQQITATNALDSGLAPVAPVAPPIELQEGLEDKTEEKKLREAAQVALQSCLASVKEETETIQVDSENEEHPTKRARSEDPGGGPGVGQSALGGPLRST